MGLSRGEARNKEDVDEIFSHIYSDLTSVHPSNECFRIFFQYFQPLFDLVLGVVCLKINKKENIIATSYLDSQMLDELKKVCDTALESHEPVCVAFEDCEHCKQLKQKGVYHVDRGNSCLILPVWIEGCTCSRVYYKGCWIGSFVLFSRLSKERFGDPEKPLLDHISRQITASFLQQGARNEFLLRTERHNCVHQKPVCDGTGAGPLARVGAELCHQL